MQMQKRIQSTSSRPAVGLRRVARRFWAHSAVTCGILTFGVLGVGLRVELIAQESGKARESAAAARSVATIDVSRLAPLTGPGSESVKVDYLVETPQRVAQVFRSADSRELILDNGLIRRTWRLEPNGACIGFDNLMTGEAMLRSVRPEARVTIDGEVLAVGGLTGQPNHAFLTPAWLDAMEADPQSLQLVGFDVGEPVERFPWARRRHCGFGVSWPPAGVSLRLDFAHQELPIRVSVHYELYDGIPVLCKWITVHNNSASEISVDRITGEELALVESASWVERREGVPLPRPDMLHVETDFAFGGFNHPNANRHVVHWRVDPLYTTQVNYERQSPCLLVVEPTYGPAQQVSPGETFESFRIFELAYDHANRERRGLALRQMYRRIAPWAMENPITHHLLSHDPDRVRQAIDEAADVGFEAVLLSFGSGFDMENQDPQFLATWRSVADYAAQRGIELGSYSLFSSRNVGDEHAIVAPEGQRPTHGQCPAVTSVWGRQWLATMRSFYDATGFDQFENDGPYPGDVDTTARPPWQQGVEDSRWVQWRMTSRLYRDLRARGIYINAPDYYFLNGSNKCGMGYREVNWSLPRRHQVIHTRQNIYDGSWTKTPSMGWMFVPLSQYHGGGAAATIEPLDEHLDHYERMMQSNFGLGVQAHYRGPRLYDTQRTRDMVHRNVAWFKKYRDILESDLLHGRRADGRDLDWMLHANPNLENKGMLCVYNPLEESVAKTLRVNLYYTGLKRVARVGREGKEFVTRTLDRNGRISLDVTVAPQGMSWYLIR